MPPLRWWLTVLLLILGPSGPSWADSWTDSRSAGPFVCHANFPLDGLEPLFQELQGLQHDLIRSLGIRPDCETMELYLFRDETSYRSYVTKYLPQVPYRQALYVKIGNRGMVFAHQGKAFAVDLRHECTHALLHAALPLVPLWLDEGLAEYFEVPAADRPSANPYLGSVRWLSQLGLLPSLEKLQQKATLDQMGSSEYRASWAWIHFLLHGPEAAHQELLQYLGDIQDERPPGLLATRLRQKLPNLDQQLAAHFRNWKK